jgi:hypothetical protein
LDKKSIKHINNTAELAQGHSWTFPSSEMLHDMRNTKKQWKFPTSEQHHDVRKIINSQHQSCTMMWVTTSELHHDLRNTKEKDNTQHQSFIMMWDDGNLKA